MTGQISIEEVIEAHAAEAVQLVQRTLGVGLNYSEQSLQHIDRLLQLQLGNGVLQPAQMTDAACDELWQFCKTVGAYVGEVMRKNNTGYWLTRPLEGGGVSIYLLVADMVESQPLDAVWNALTVPFKDSMVSYYRGLLVALGKGETSEIDGIKQVQLPDLSDNPPV